MNTLSRTELRELTESGKGPCLSIYLAASMPGGEGAPARLNRLLRQGEMQLTGQYLAAEVAEQIVHAVRDGVFRGPLWQADGEGLAIFSSPGLFRCYAVSGNVTDLATVGNRFHVKPLFPAAIEAQSRYYVLALSQNAVRLYQGDSDHLTQIGDRELPQSPLAPAEDEPGGGQGLFHLHHAHHERRKQMLLTYFRGVDEVLRTRLGVKREPIVLAGVAYLCALYRHACRSPYVVAGEIHGNPFQLGREELRQRSWDLASAYFQSVRERIADEYYLLWHTSRASNDIRDIATAARNGRIETLFVGLGDPRRLVGAGPDQDTLSALAIDTYIAGGTVYGVSPEQVPGHGPAAAIFRY